MVYVEIEVKEEENDLAVVVSVRFLAHDVDQFGAGGVGVDKKLRGRNLGEHGLEASALEDYREFPLVAGEQRLGFFQPLLQGFLCLVSGCHTFFFLKEHLHYSKINLNYSDFYCGFG